MSSNSHVNQSRSVAMRSLWLLTLRDLKVRYSTSLLGYFWSILDPLIMSLIYWFIFTQLMDRALGEDPYIVFLLCGILPWVWFNTATSDATRAFLRDVKLVRSVSLARWVWVGRITASKGIEFLLSIPVLILFAIATNAQVNTLILLYPLAIVLLTILVLGVGLFIAPLVVLFRDLERATKLILRVLFYATPIIYSASDLPSSVQFLAWLNPLSGIVSLFRAGFFPSELNWALVGVSALLSVMIFGIGVLVFNKTIGGVLKEL